MTQRHLELGGAEIGSALRTLTYLRRGMGGSGFDVGVDGSVVIPPECRQTITGDTFAVGYPTGYGGTTETVCDPVDPFDPRGLRCYCAAVDRAPYLSPAADPAPWYNPARPESGDFLGFMPDTVDLLPTITRGISQGERGGTLGLPRLGGYVVAVTGELYAASDAGMEYGQRWLSWRLVNDEDPALRLLPFCEPARWRSLLRVGLVDGPVFTPANDVPAAKILPVAFQLASEEPWMLSDPITVLSQPGVLMSNPTKIALPPLEGPGDSGLRILLEARNGEVGGAVTFTLTLPPGGNCSAHNPPVIWRAGVSSLAAGAVVEIDANAELMAVRLVGSDDVFCGLDCLDYTPPWSWPILPAAQAACLTISGAITNAYFTVERRLQEI